MSDIEDQFKPIAYQYGKVESDKAKSRYELEVNWPSIREMLPPIPAKIMDYGCGSGVYTRLLLAAGYEVLGVDNSEDMIAQMRDIAANARIWTYQETPLPIKFNAVVAKLVVQFVEDLEMFGRTMHRQLNKGGALIISIPHPDRSRQQLINGNKIYMTEVGTSGLMVNMIHREQGEVVLTLERSGLKLEKIDAPIDPSRKSESPKRLNLLFRLAD